jgi:hypothetical protein
MGNSDYTARAKKVSRFRSFEVSRRKKKPTTKDTKVTRRSGVKRSAKGQAT